MQKLFPVVLQFFGKIDLKSDPWKHQVYYVEMVPSSKLHSLYLPMQHGLHESSSYIYDRRSKTKDNGYQSMFQVSVNGTEKLVHWNRYDGANHLLMEIPEPASYLVKKAGGDLYLAMLC